MNKVQHFLLPADNISRAKEFYHHVFGWKFEPKKDLRDDYHFVTTTPVDEHHKPKEKEAINGGLFRRGSHQLKTTAVVVEVESIEEALNNGMAAGGTVTMPKSEVEGHGFFAQLVDTEGNTIGLWEPV